MYEIEENKSDAWPTPGDVLFQTEDHGCHAWIPGRPAWGLYSQGYKDAADLVVNHAIETNRHADFLIYPIVFLYRHNLELLMKHIIYSGQNLLGESPNVPTVHRFEVLWPMCRNILERIWPSSSDKELNAVSDCVREFSAIDPHSTNFRYPVAMDGEASLSEVEPISLNNLQLVVNRISDFLDTAAFAISALSSEG